MYILYIVHPESETRALTVCINTSLPSREEREGGVDQGYAIYAIHTNARASCACVYVPAFHTPTEKCDTHIRYGITVYVMRMRT